MSESQNIHPCFNKEMVKKSARIHLPLVKTCNINCNYCNRLYNCPNENRPGVTSKLIKPEDVFEIVKKSLYKYHNLNIVGIAGPGEALAEPETVYKAFKIVRDNFPELKLCLSTNGMALLDSLDLIRDLNLDFITVTVNTMSVDTASKIYKTINFEEFIAGQKKGIQELAKLNITVKINTVAIPDVNYGHELNDIVDVAKFAGESGLFAQNIMPFYPVNGSVFQDIREPSKDEINLLRQECSKYIKQISHCKRCRADAEGYL